MSDGREEREERRIRLEQEKLQRGEDQVERDPQEECEPERGGS